jgi:hypothetical protein
MPACASAHAGAKKKPSLPAARASSHVFFFGPTETKELRSPSRLRFSSLFRFELVVTFFKKRFRVFRTPLSRRVSCSNDRLGFSSNFGPAFFAGPSTTRDGGLISLYGVVLNSRLPLSPLGRHRVKVSTWPAKMGYARRLTARGKLVSIPRMIHRTCACCCACCCCCGSVPACGCIPKVTP